MPPPEYLPDRCGVAAAKERTAARELPREAARTPGTATAQQQRRQRQQRTTSPRSASFSVSRYQRRTASVTTADSLARFCSRPSARMTTGSAGAVEVAAPGPSPLLPAHEQPALTLSVCPCAYGSRWSGWQRGWHVLVAQAAASVDGRQQVRRGLLPSLPPGGRKRRLGAPLTLGSHLARCSVLPSGAQPPACRHAKDCDGVATSAQEAGAACSLKHDTVHTLMGRCQQPLAAERARRCRQTAASEQPGKRGSLR